MGNCRVNGIAWRTIIQWLLFVFYYLCNALAPWAIIFICEMANSITALVRRGHSDTVAYMSKALRLKSDSPGYARHSFPCAFVTSHYYATVH